MAFISTSIFVMVVNGSIHGPFDVKKDLRQGVIYKLIYIMLINYLTRNLMFISQQGALKFHPLCNSCKLIDVYFLNDLFF